MNASTPGNRRRGLTTVAVLICLLILTLIGGALLRLAVAQRRELRDQEQRLQAEWLAQAGLDRALHQLAASADYTGERWPIPGAALGLAGPAATADSPAAVVSIAVERPAGTLSQRRIQVHADYPPDLPRRARHSLQMLVDLGPNPTGVSR